MIDCDVILAMAGQPLISSVCFVRMVLLNFLLLFVLVIESAGINYKLLLNYMIEWKMKYTELIDNICFI